MKVTILHGSPRKNGNSDTLVEYFKQGYTKNNPAIFHDFYLNDMQIKPCQGCLYCATSDDHKCKISDDMTQIYASFKDSDLVVMSSPMYWGYVTAQLKTAIDRMESLAWKYFHGKIFLIIFTYRHHVESAKGFFERVAPFFKLKLYFVIAQTYNEDTQEDVPILEMENELNASYKMGEKIRFDIQTMD